MPSTVENWFKEYIHDKVTTKFQALGGYLDGTMTQGDVQANLVKFPVEGRLEVYELTGAIEPVPVNTIDLTTVQVIMRDFEASGYWRVQDAYKSGPQEQDALARMIVKAARRKRDKIKLDALVAFQTAFPAATNLNLPGVVNTYGTGVEVPDIKIYHEAASDIFATGAEGTVYAAIRAKTHAQLLYYKEYADAKFIGESGPWSDGQRTKMRRVQDIVFMTLPDEYFVFPTGTSVHEWMWHESAMGVEMPFVAEQVTMDQTLLQGKPWLVRNNMSGAAIGILPEGVRRLHLLKSTTITRPV